MTIAKITEISSQSPKSFDEAIRVGLARAAETLKNIQGAWIKEQKVIVDDKGHISQYRVDMKISFVLTE